MKNRVMSGWVTVTGPPSADLAHEGRHDAAAAAEHVAEPHRAPAAALRGVREDELLAEPLGGAHDVRGIDGLVGRDEDEVRDPGVTRRGDEVPGPEDVGRCGLGGVRLEQRDVLVRRGVEDDLRPLLPRTAGSRRSRSRMSSRTGWRDRRWSPSRRRGWSHRGRAPAAWPASTPRPAGRSRTRSSHRRR
jgi:hypothetical protein